MKDIKNIFNFKDHFEESQYENNRQDGWKKLKQTAIPTIFSIPNPPESVSQKRVKGFGCPKPNTLLSAHLNPDHQVILILLKLMYSNY